MIFDEHDCEKDIELGQLQQENNILECKVREERNKNYRLQLQLIEALSKKTLNIHLPDASNPDLNEIEREESDNVVTYRGHLHITKDADNVLKAIPNEKQSDRLFIRTLFDIVFGTEYLRQQYDTGKEKSKVIEEIETTANFLTMRAMYEYRVLSHGTEDAAERYSHFKEVVRKKIHNFWQFFCSKSKKRKYSSEQQQQKRVKNNTSDEQHSASGSHAIAPMLI